MGKLGNLKNEKIKNSLQKKNFQKRKFIIGTTLLLFGALTFILQYFALEQFYNLAIERTANSLSPIIKNLFDDIERELLEENLGYIDLGLEELIYDEMEGLSLLALRSLEVSDVISVYAYNHKGKLLNLPTNLEKERSRLFSLEEVKSRKKITKFQEDELSIIFPIGELAELGFLELNINPKPNIIPERKAIKSQVIKQGLIVFITGSILLFFVFSVFFKQLEVAESQLLAKTEDLKHTNHRLVLACKTAGLGAITAHLMHAIKSPLMGLKNLELTEKNSDKKMVHNVLNSTTKQIENLVNETMNCIKEFELDEDSYSFEACEILSLTTRKFDQKIWGDRVGIIANKWDHVKINNLQANLLLPILQNLVQNALETNRSTKVFLEVKKLNENLNFLISDNGSGIPEQIRENLFTPIQSAKENGSGLGLAICKGLTEQLGGKILLKSSTEQGTTFCVEIRPNERLQ